MPAKFAGMQGDAYINIRTNLIFLETRIDLHFATDIAWVRLSSFNFFSGGLHKTIFFRKSAFRPFKVIQGD